MVRTRGLGVTTIFKNRGKLNRDETRTNGHIRARQVRLIDEQGRQVGVVDTYQALQMAEEVGLDLVEVAPDARPPVCKIIDYGKHKYEKKKKQKAHKPSKLKELRLRPGTDEHDIQVKLRKAKEFLEHGDKLQLVVKFKGRENRHRDQGRDVLLRFATELKDISRIDRSPLNEGRRMVMVLSPNSK